MNQNPTGKLPVSMQDDRAGAPQYFRSTKAYTNFPCAHRQYLHHGNCALVHGYSRSFTFLFAAKTLDRCGFVVDFGELKWLKSHLDHMFDHTLLLMENDPLLPTFRQIEDLGGAAIRLMPYGVGMEGTAQYLCEYADVRLREFTKGRCWVESVESRENDKNSAIYVSPSRGWTGWL